MNNTRKGTLPARQVLGVAQDCPCQRCLKANSGKATRRRLVAVRFHEMAVFA